MKRINNQKTHYFLTPKRSRANSSPDCPFIPIGSETDTAVQLRYQSYSKLWSNQQSKIEDILNNANNDLFTNLSSFIQSEGISNLSRRTFHSQEKLSVAFLQLSSNTANNLRILQEFSEYLTTTSHEKVSKFPQMRVKSETSLLDGDDQEPLLPHGSDDEAQETLLPRGIKDEDQEPLLPRERDDETQAYISESPNYRTEPVELEARFAHTNRIINLNSKSCSNIKSSLRDMVRQYLEADGETNADSNGYVNYDLDIIKDKLAQNPIPNLRIIMIIQDTNSINNHVLNQLIRILHSYSNLPLRIIFGISSNNISNWINSNLSNDNRILISGLKFRSNDNKTLGYKIINELFLKEDSYLVSPTLVTILLDRFENSNNSIDSLVSEVKLCYMVHFYGNPMAAISEYEVIPKNLVSALRKIPSFKVYIEKEIFLNTPNKGHLQQLLTNDDSLLAFFSQRKKEIHDYKLDVLESVESSTSKSRKFEIYKDIVNGKVEPLPPINSFTFHELFSLNGGQFNHSTPIFSENYSNLMIKLVRPSLRSTLELALDDSTGYLQSARTTAAEKFSPPTLNVLFRVYKEAPVLINIYDFFLAFKLSLERVTEDDEEWDKMLYCWFIQNCYELVMLGLLKEKPKGDYLEKAVWKGV